MRRLVLPAFLVIFGSCAMSDRAEAPAGAPPPMVEGGEEYAATAPTTASPGSPAEEPVEQEEYDKAAEPAPAPVAEEQYADEAKPSDEKTVQFAPKPSVKSEAGLVVTGALGDSEGVEDLVFEAVAEHPEPKSFDGAASQLAQVPDFAPARQGVAGGVDLPAGALGGMGARYQAGLDRDDASGFGAGKAGGEGGIGRRVHAAKKKLSESKDQASAQDPRANPWHQNKERALDENEKQDAVDGTVTRNVTTAHGYRGGRARTNNQVLLPDADVEMDLEPEAPLHFQKPERFLPRMAYFENTYLGGNAAHQQMVRQIERDLRGVDKPWQEAYAAAQPFDPPSEQALGLSATLDRRWVDGEGPVYLQVGIQGSRRYGWRRPPLDVVLVVDGPALAAGTQATDELVGALLRSLGPQDRLGIVVAGERVAVLSEIEPVKGLRAVLAERLQRLSSTRGSSPASLERAIDVAGGLLQTAAQAQARVPGSQVTLVAVAGDAPDGPERAQRAAAAAHRLTLQGAMTSIVELGTASEGPYWQVASAGHGNYHRAAAGEERDVVTTELELLSKVVARLLRINIRLAPGSSAVRILGSRVLGAEQVRQVKAREVATDRNLSRTLGVTADRGEDDDGLQTVIPYYYGGDSHVILVELWVDGPGAVADVTLRYKDMVTLDNATSRASVSLAATPRPALPEQLLVRRNLQGFALADALRGASAALARHDTGGAMTQLNLANRFARGEADAEVISGFSNLVRDSAGDPEAAEPVWRAMGVAARQRVGLQRR
ncbi:MAG: VWA domain-containing protein [Myxococcota bacterium]